MHNISLHPFYNVFEIVDIIIYRSYCLFQAPVSFYMTEQLTDISERSLSLSIISSAFRTTASLEDHISKVPLSVVIFLTGSNL